MLDWLHFSHVLPVKNMAEGSRPGPSPGLPAPTPEDGWWDTSNVPDWEELVVNGETNHSYILFGVKTKCTKLQDSTTSKKCSLLPVPVSALITFKRVAKQRNKEML